jgi:5,10-methylenetetrahydromethanopterin reductase
MVEFWTNAPASPRGLMRLARDYEVNGWDGVYVVDSQNLSGDPYIALAMAATVTERIGLGTAVTNSVTRTAAATATAAASVNRVADGRMVLGIGRGDSALAHLGRAPARVAQFEAYLRHLQTYLRGDAVPFDEIDIPDDVAPPVQDLGLADSPTESRIAWIGGTQKVPVEVAATGPRIIELAALLADRVMLTVGADIERLKWGIELGREARRKAGLDPDGVAFGAFVNCAAHSDAAVARGVARGGLTVFARFSVMHGKTHGPLTPEAERALQTLRDAYDMNAHTHGDSNQAKTLTDDFIDHFGVVGTPEQCVEKLKAIVALGFDKISVGGNLRINETPGGPKSKALLEQEVFPALRR